MHQGEKVVEEVRSACTWRRFNGLCGAIMVSEGWSLLSSTQGSNTVWVFFFLQVTPCIGQRAHAEKLENYPEGANSEQSKLNKQGLP